MPPEDSDEAFFELADYELNSGLARRGLLIKLEIEANGDKIKSRLQYISTRVAEMKAQFVDAPDFKTLLQVLYPDQCPSEPDNASPGNCLEPNKGQTLKEMVEEFEKAILEHVLRKHHGNAAAASRYLNTTQRIINYRIKNLGLEPRHYK